MRAIMIHPPHDLRVESFPESKPSPTAGEVLVRMAAGGICGSDLHYYHHGGFGAVRVKEAMALGHEASGHVEAIGKGVTGLAVGDLVAVNPSQPCGTCPSCGRAELNHCENMRFNGSAMRMPHVQGLFREYVTAPRARIFRIDPAVSAAEAALCEPLAVALHAVKQAGDLKGKTVLVTGCGPIGVLAIVAAKLAGAGRVIATDITAHSLDIAAKLGCDTLVNLAETPDGLQPFTENRGQIDALLECSGNPRALAGAIPALKPRGRVVLVGLGGDAPVPINAIVAKELEIVGTFRFCEEFAVAADLISSRKVKLGAMISATYPMAQAVEAFEHASDKARATKVAVLLG
jgi:L-idonate 5-dehydrogenase